jgi:hypothetical protein
LSVVTRAAGHRDPTAALGPASWSGIVLAGLALGALTGLFGPLSLVVIPILSAGTLVLTRLDLVAPALIVASLFQAIPFALPLGGARIYPYQILGLVGVFSLACALASGRLALRAGLLELALVGYLAVNYVAIGMSPSPSHALRVALLLTTLAATYVVVANMVPPGGHLGLALNTLLVAGVAESLYGVYQMLAGVLAFHTGLDLPTGHVGIRPEGRIGFGYGQPYGTFQEPGWMGVVLMFFALVFAALYLGSDGRRRHYALGFLSCGLGVLVSFSRAAWGGLLFGLVLLLIMSRALGASRRLVAGMLGIVIVLAGVVTVAALASEQVAMMLGASLAFDEGSNAISFTNTRVLHIVYSFDLFLREPWLGHGPGNFAIQGFPVAFPYLEFAQYDKIPFDPSIVTTILGNTGLIGLGAFLLCVAAYVALQRRALAVARPVDRRVVAALLVGIVGLFFSYVITTGFWMGFTWVFLGLSVGAARHAIEHGAPALEASDAHRN